MKVFPHQYRVRASASEQSSVELSSSGLTPLASAPPAQFDGPGDMWSPETLLVGAVADCFILTFRAIAKASSFQWGDLSCEAEGTVERPEGVTRFTAMDLDIHLAVRNAADVDRAKKLVEKAERSCLISNSLKVQPTFRVNLAVNEERLVA